MGRPSIWPTGQPARTLASPGAPALRRRQALGLGLLCAALAPVRSWAEAAPSAPATTAPLRVVASFSVLADMAREVGGDAVEVSALVGPNADAHAFTPSPAHARRLLQADLVVVNGLGFEGWIDRLVRATGYSGPVVVATQGLTPRRAGPHADPHAWQSLVHAQRYAENLRAAFVKARPAQAADLGRRAADYTRRLATLDSSIRSRLAAVPMSERVVVTSHDAFGYFAEAYGVRFQAAQGWNSASEASAADVAGLIRQLKGQRVRALFVENINDPRLLERIAKEAGATVGGTLYSDALSAPGTAADTYLRLMAHNADTLLAALRPPADASRR